MTNPDDLREQIAALLQARLPWPTADACATDIVQMFERKGWAVVAGVQLAAARAAESIARRLFDGWEPEYGDVWVRVWHPPTGDPPEREAEPMSDAERAWLAGSTEPPEPPIITEVPTPRGRPLPDQTIVLGGSTEPPEPKCICKRFRDTGGYRIADLTCPSHGVDGTDPGDGPWDPEEVSR